MFEIVRHEDVGASLVGSGRSALLGSLDLRDLSDDAQLLWFFIYTHPNSSNSGVIAGENFLTGERRRSPRGTDD